MPIHVAEIQACQNKKNTTITLGFYYKYQLATSFIDKCNLIINLPQKLKTIITHKVTKWATQQPRLMYHVIKTSACPYWSFISYK